MAQAKTQENPLAQKPVMAEMEVHYHVETAAAVPSSCWPKQQQNQAKHPASCRLARSPLPAHGASQAHFYAVRAKHLASCRLARSPLPEHGASQAH